MSRPPAVARMLLALRFRREAREIIVGDLNEEFAELVASGVSERSARRHYVRQALASVFGFGQPDLWFHGMELDVRYAVRTLARSPAFVGVAALSLGLGIGANSAVFSVVRSLVLDSLPVNAPEDLRVIYWWQPRKDARIPELNSTGYADPGSGRGFRSNYTLSEYRALRRTSTDQADLFAFNFVRQVNVSTSGAPATAVSGILVSDNFFRGLRVPMTAGRPLDASDERPDAPLVTVISHALWHRVFGGNPQVIGQLIRVNGQPVQVIGVTAAGFRGMSLGGFFPPTDLTFPLSALEVAAPGWTPGGRSLLIDNEWHWLRVMARVTSRTDEDRLAAQLAGALGQQLAAAGILRPTDVPTTELRLIDGRRGPEPIRRDIEQSLRMVSGVVVVGLLLACVNLAGLTVARGIARQRELALRRALGAGRFRLVRQLLIESLIIALAGGAIGLAIAQWGGPPLARLLTTSQFGPLVVDFSIDKRLVSATGAFCGVATLLFGLLPALRLSRDDSHQLKHRDVGNVGRRLTAGRWLVALQMAISVPLVVGAGLLLQTTRNFGAVNLGFNPAQLVLFRVNPTIGKSVGAVQASMPARLYQDLVTRIEAVPGVQSVAVLENILAGGMKSQTSVTIDGTRQSLLMNAVGPRFFETMAIPILAGREIDARDTHGAPGAVVVNEAAARQYFGGSALGRRFFIGQREVEIVGVAANTRYQNLRTEIMPVFFDSYLQRSAQPGSMRVAVRYAGPAGTLESAIRRAVASLDSALPILDFQSQTEAIDATIAKERAFTRVLALFGCLALLLAAIGLYGVTAQTVSRRTNEIGMRVALGARHRQIVWLILRHVIVLAAAGLAVGLPTAVALSPLVQSLLYGVESTDITTLGVSGVVMLTVALVAGWLPARRAARLDPVVALRRE
jgi:predicted permease